MPGDALIVIPARYGSTRFPGKPLAEIAGVPMIVRVARLAAAVRGAAPPVVATDDRRILEVVREAGFEAEMTARSHRSGTARVAEVAARRSNPIVVNVQGDEPLLPVRGVEKLIEVLQADRRCVMATLATPSRGAEAIARPDVVKVAVDRDGHALYFSRSAIPHGAEVFLHHIGVYAFRRAFLLRFCSLPRGPFEKAEGLEQLRALENGHRIRVVHCRAQTCGVDRPEDIKRVETRLR
ncbi:MAG: 3-deoxy-manno-octulosonate cytidylyltransferase [Candidatus Krumholzibacteria bacterium]|nr:3-deoxy-manno-octulosonate cytidylyltransferase [Candidatus Krumholzibacteria bacterium]